MRPPLTGAVWLALFMIASGAGALAQDVVTFKPEANGQITFVTPSKNIECTFTPAGGTTVYKPFDGGPELSCDRSEPKYLRLVLTAKSVRRFDDVGDQSCCGAANVLNYGARWLNGPFTCTSAESGLTCRLADGRGFLLSRASVKVY